eukprot:Selendium_serpulae@DN4297_c0_g1_i3.p2
MGFLQVSGRTVSTGEWYIGPLPVTVSSREYSDARPGLVLDFSRRMSDLCPPEGADASLFDLAMLPRRAALNSARWPVRNFVDQVRVVGRDPHTNQLLMLGRTLQTDEDLPDLPARTAWYFLLRSDDPAVLPRFRAGTALPPSIPFEYHHQGVGGLAARLIPKGLGRGGGAIGPSPH